MQACSYLWPRHTPPLLRHITIHYHTSSVASFEDPTMAVSTISIESIRHPLFVKDSFCSCQRGCVYASVYTSACVDECVCVRVRVSVRVQNYVSCMRIRARACVCVCFEGFRQMCKCVIVFECYIQLLHARNSLCRKHVLADNFTTVSKYIQ